jgi:hypothetical protein
MSSETVTLEMDDEGYVRCPIHIEKQIKSDFGDIEVMKCDLCEKVIKYPGCRFCLIRFDEYYCDKCGKLVCKNCIDSDYRFCKDCHKKAVKSGRNHSSSGEEQAEDGSYPDYDFDYDYNNDNDPGVTGEIEYPNVEPDVDGNSAIWGSSDFEYK